MMEYQRRIEEELELRSEEAKWRIEQYLEEPEKFDHWNYMEDMEIIENYSSVAAENFRMEFVEELYIYLDVAQANAEHKVAVLYKDILNALGEVDPSDRKELIA